MFSAVNGKNTMLNFDFKRNLTPIVICAFLLFLSCSSKTENNSNSDTTAVADTSAQTEDDQIEALMNEAMDRLRYKDKSFLYENEFAYYREKYTFAYYLNEVKIKSAQADTLEHVNVVSVTYYGTDSARADVEVHFKGPSGNKTILREPNAMLYRRDGHWIKPTVSNSLAQRQYEEIRENAEKAAKSESGGSSK